MVSHRYILSPGQDWLPSTLSVERRDLPATHGAAGSGLTQ